MPHTPLPPPPSPPSPPSPPRLAPSRVTLAADGGADDAVARWQAHLDAGRIGAPRGDGPRPDYARLDRLFGRDRVGIW